MMISQFGGRAPARVQIVLILRPDPRLPGVAQGGGRRPALLAAGGAPVPDQADVVDAEGRFEVGQEPFVVADLERRPAL